MIGFLKKFVNSTIGTRNMKPIDEMIQSVEDGQNDLKTELERKHNDLKTELERGIFAGVNYKTYTGVISSNFPYFSEHRFRADILAGANSDYNFIITSLQCVISAKLNTGEGVFYNIPVYYNRNTDELVISAPNNGSRFPECQSTMYYRVTVCVERRYKQKY